MSDPAILRADGIRSGYHGVTVVKGLDFEVGSEVFAVLGANGAGKTTLLATLARLIPLMAGTIRFQGEEVGTLPPFETAGRGVGYVRSPARETPWGRGDGRGPS